MLLELRVENLLLIERAELRFDAGLNVVTGETGAGKTLLAHALDLLLGGRPRRGILRPGASEAYVEGVFSTSPRLAYDPDLAELCERLPLGSEELVLARRVTTQGRTRCYLQGRSVSANDLRAVATRLLAFYGQHEHRKLMLASTQLDVLDAFCGDVQLQARAEFERLWSEARALERELSDLRARAGARERDLDLLDFELSEIDAAAPSEREEAELEAERARLAAVETLRQACWAARTALDSSGDSGEAEGALAALASAASALDRTRELDRSLDTLGERCRQLAYEAEDLARELRNHGESLEADPERLAQVEERIELLARLKRKHGGTIGSVLEHADRCRAERDRLSNAEETTERLEERLARTVRELEDIAGRLHDARERAGRGLERAVRKELGRLAMADSSFEIVLSERDAGGGLLERFGPRGADAVEFLIAPNRGVPAGPLKEIASGGELSRVMLALLSVATHAGGAATVVFDEVDAGVGGSTARAVGEKLRDLAGKQQVICITHLPQVASFGGRHFRVAKHPGGARAPARAEVEQLDRGGLVAELCRMLGADVEDGTARRHAERLLRAA